MSRNWENTGKKWNRKRDEKEKNSWLNDAGRNKTRRLLNEPVQGLKSIDRSSSWFMMNGFTTS